ncbi:MAG TPA: hypothetical protein VGF07_07665 [Stellaceae bacterium]|jgi:hypothetical protein
MQASNFQIGQMPALTFAALFAMKRHDGKRTMENQMSTVAAGNVLLTHRA